ncbi:MAG TPA: type I DNA topoisomerase [bacterium]|jgi:DNA topoisomerase-1
MCPEEGKTAQKEAPKKKKPTKKSRSGKPLVILESKAKARTVARYLGRGYNVKACLGHVRDLPKTSLGIDIDNDFKPNYVTNRDRRDTIDDLKKAAKSAESIFIATDPDREGEAIAWHLNHIFKQPEKTKRIEFYEVTKSAVKTAMENPREIDGDRVNAWQARRILDRLVGYNLSPYLWREIQSGLSAGRVQSVATKVICEREDEIEAFVPVEYWTIDGMFRKSGDEYLSMEPFKASLAKINDENIELGNQDSAESAVRDLAEQVFSVSNINTRQISRKPSAPFITSTLQQEASKRLGFSARRTMTLAQQLYEGIDVGEGGEEGLITYMRTDSVRLSAEAVDAARDYIKRTFGPEYLPESPIEYKSKKRVQDAHEAIRPTRPERSPQAVKAYLNETQFKLYQLIWQRYTACQMVPGRDEQTTIEITGGKYLFRTTKTKKVFDGYRKVYPASNNNKDSDTDYGGELPDLEVGVGVTPDEFLPEQHFTKPPPRYTTASLVKKLEEEGIGRPSTYAPIISTIIDRKYVEREGQAFKPTSLGRQVNSLLVEKFSDIIDESFTARMEDNLDSIQSGDTEWVSKIREFYEPFRKDLKEALDMECPKCGSDIAIRNGRFGAFFACTNYPECDWRSSISPKTPLEEPVPLEEECPECSSKLVLKHGRYGKFVACTGFPNCRYTRSIKDDSELPESAAQGEVRTQEAQFSEKPCPKCNNRMVLRRSRSGRFWGCEKFPACDGIRPYTIGVACTRDGCDGEFVERQTRKGKRFYSCSNYPACDETSWTYPGKREEKTEPTSDTEAPAETA